VRSSSTDDIACWFVDTNYNEESFFVREAYFTGAGDPYGSLRKALRADIDEATWATLYTTESRAFPAPETGKIAVKVDQPLRGRGDEGLLSLTSRRAFLKRARLTVAERARRMVAPTRRQARRG
jgi:hypothetical protein